MSPELDIKTAMETARLAAEAAKDVSLKFWRSGVEVERKPDRSPVTQADRAAEEAILDVIRPRHPDHAILAEESGMSAGTEPYRWIIDPIDGTRGFTRGGRFWGALIALEGEEGILAGAMCLPAMGDVFWAGRGLGCYHNGARVQLGARTERWEEATLSLGELSYLWAPPWHDAVQELVFTAESARNYGDLEGFALVLRGVADAWLEAGVQSWDIGPVPVLIREAGGVFSNFRGDDNLAHGTAIAATPALHAYLLDALKPYSPT